MDVKRWLSWAQLITGIFGVIALISNASLMVSERLNSVVTASELARHDSDHKSHAYLLSLNSQCEERANALRQDLLTQRFSSTELGAHLVRLVAADRETHAPLRAKASLVAEERYRSLVRRGESIESALREAVRVRR